MNMGDFGLGPIILECTLRDGSYAIDFQFTAQDTTRVAGALDAMGFPLIEVGHGIGVGASEKGFGTAAETDEAYMVATAKAVSKGAWGMFCIPGIGELDHVAMLADNGGKFIRIGANVTEVDSMAPFLAAAKQRDILTGANFMKSYASTPEVFAECALRAVNHGADIIYIVDSAGGMLPNEIAAYIEAVRAITDAPLGFHGHNNLGLAVANSLLAVENGVKVVDASLQGLGRSSGNTVTEQILAVLERNGYDLGIDLIEVSDIAERLIHPLIARTGVQSIDTVLGLSQFHSSYMGIIREFASKYDIDPRRLIMAVSNRDRIEAPRDLVEEEAGKLAAKGQAGDSNTARFHLQQYHGEEETIDPVTTAKSTPAPEK
jgi:4-hydroxy-2-oxovalerate aldolase